MLVVSVSLIFSRSPFLQAMARAAFVVAFSVATTGCGNVVYSYRAYDATSRIEEARKAGAERSALYEYTLAEEHLKKAKTEAAEADYGDASELADLAREYAQRATDKAKYRTANQTKPHEGSDDTTHLSERASFSISAGEQK
jgi:Domain of unknown function (DUF4398)